MIVKRIMPRRGSGNYQRLAAYVLNVASEHRAADPARWTLLRAYTQDAERAGERVAWERASNCQGDDPGWAVKEILATQAGNQRSRADKSYHLVVSFPDGERPARAQVEDIEDVLCAAVGLEQHQRISALHQNTDNWHLHVAINRVHPRTTRMSRCFQEYYRLQAAAAELEIRHGLRRERHTTAPQGQGDNLKIKGRAEDFEVWRGRPSFLRWLRETAAPALLAARDGGQGWPGLHAAAACFDLEISRHSAGLVVGHRRVARLRHKASDVDRGLSLKAVTDALGPFQPPGQDMRGPPTVSYATPAPSGPLYEAFKQARIAAVAARNSALATLHEQHLNDARRRAVAPRDRLPGEQPTEAASPSDRDTGHHVAGPQRTDRAETARREADERRQVRARHPIPTWQSYLETEASTGNEQALAVLRDRFVPRARTEVSYLQAEDAGDGRHIVHVHLRPAVRRDGRVIYRTADSGVVSDEARRICLKNVTEGAVSLALSLAMDRFGQRLLTVNGTDDFRTQVAELAGVKGFDVRFSDDMLEKRRASAALAQKAGVGRDREHAHAADRPSTGAEWRGHDR